MNKQRIFVTVPSFNEAKVISSTLDDLVSRGYSIVLIDDGSADDTEVAVKRYPVHYLRHPVNLGQGAALQTGMSYALKMGAEVIVHFDADGQHPAAQIPALIAPILAGECDVALGSRFLNPADTALVPWSRRLMLRLGRLLNGLLAGLWLTDAHNGFRALSRKAAQQINLSEGGFAHATEVLDQIRRARLRWKEVPSTIRYSQYSKGKGQKITSGVNIALDLVLRKVLK